MTETLDETLEPVVLPANVSGFGLAEVAYLLSRHSGPATTRTAALTALDQLAPDASFHLAGASSLVARGWLTEEAGKAQTRGPAALLEYAMGASDQWVQLQIVDDAGVGLAFVTRGPALASLWQPSAVGSWFAEFNDNLDDFPGFVQRAVESVFGLHPDAAVAVTVVDVDGPGKSLRVRRHGEGWDVGDAADGTGPSLGVDASGLKARLAALVG